MKTNSDFVYNDEDDDDGSQEEKKSVMTRVTLCHIVRLIGLETVNSVTMTS